MPPLLLQNICPSPKPGASEHDIVWKEGLCGWDEVKDEEVILDGPETSVLMRETQRTRQTQERSS